MLFKFDFMVEGKNLERALTALAGIAIEMQTPVPVSNGIIKKGVVKQQVAGTNHAERVMNKLTMDGIANKGEFISSKIIQAAMDDLHISKNSYSFVIKSLKERDFLTTTERRGTLRVL